MNAAAELESWKYAELDNQEPIVFPILSRGSGGAFDIYHMQLTGAPQGAPSNSAQPSRAMQRFYESFPPFAETPKLRQIVVSENSKLLFLPCPPPTSERIQQMFRQLWTWAKYVSRWTTNVLGCKEYRRVCPMMCNASCSMLLHHGFGMDGFLCRSSVQALPCTYISSRYWKGP